MKKILLGALTLSLLVTSAAYAAPMTNLDKGTGKVDASFSFGPYLQAEEGTHTLNLDGSKITRLGATYGLGNKWGLDYKYVGHTGDYMEGVSLQSNQVNAVYQFTPNVAAFAGYVNNRFSVEDVEKEGHTSASGYQVGVLGRMEIAKRTSAWASIGVGNVINAYEVGVGYDLTHNFDLNLFYNDTKYKGFSDEAGNLDFHTHSVNLGVTYHF